MTVKEKKFISIVFRVRNHEKYIENFIHTIIPFFEKNFQNYELVCVNNDSTDKTIEKLKNICKEQYPNVTLNIINLAYCRSIEETIETGIEFTIGDFVFEFEGIIVDYDIEIIMQAYSEVLQGYDIVLLSPNKKATISQKLFYALYNLGVTKSKKIHPVTMKVLSRRAINRLKDFTSYCPNHLSNILTCGVDVKKIDYKPLENQVKYDINEKKVRIFQAIESFILYTKTIQIIELFFSILSVIVAFCFIKKIYIFLFCILISFIFMVSLIIIEYLHVLLRMDINNGIYLVKNIEKENNR